MVKKTIKLGMFVFAGAISACSTIKDMKNIDLWSSSKSGEQSHEYQPANSIPYTCEGNKKFYVRYLDKGASVWLILPDREVALAQVGSTKVYSNGISKIDLTGADVILEVNETTKYVGCQAKSIAAASKVEAQPVQAKSATKETSEKGWFDSMKFWESDDKAKQAKPAKSIATASKVEAQPVQAKAESKLETKPSTKTEAKSETKETSEKGWFDWMKFWESDDKAKQAKPTKSIATASKVEAQPVQAKAAPAEAVVKEVIPAVQVAEVKAIEPVVQTPNEPVAQAPKVEMTSELPQPIAAAKEQVASQDDTQSAVGKTVEAWANAWRTKNTTAYLSFYSAKFAPKGMSRKAWTAQRKRRVGGKRGEIKLTLDNLNIVADAKKATATFSQHYANRKYSDDVVKKLSLKNVDGQWVIVKESTKAASAK